jgi:hypothetical protein
VVSPEIVNVVEADAVPKVEGRVCAVVKRDGDAPPGSWTASRSKGRHRNPGGPVGSVAMVGDGGAVRGESGVLRRAEAGSRTDSYYR